MRMQLKEGRAYQEGDIPNFHKGRRAWAVDVGNQIRLTFLDVPQLTSPSEIATSAPFEITPEVFQEIQTLLRRQHEKEEAEKVEYAKELMAFYEKYKHNLDKLDAMIKKRFHWPDDFLAIQFYMRQNIPLETIIKSQVAAEEDPTLCCICGSRESVLWEGFCFSRPFCKSHQGIASL